jgi:hypothetical protein
MLCQTLREVQSLNKLARALFFAGCISLRKGNTWPTASPEDTLISIPKPHLEYPFYD